MRLIAVAAAFLALIAQPVLAQELSKTAPVLQKTAPATESDPDRVAEARRLTAEALAADQATVQRNAAAQADYNARLAANKAAQDRYQADLAAQRAAAAQYERDRAAWEARVKACQAGDTSQCGPR
ncbi:MAG: hypothetical protein K1X35_00860 [Caulobacteraceae bacterium]|nr:hypothetical protein [Caulobacteraceae bacterium]